MSESAHPRKASATVNTASRFLRDHRPIPAALCPRQSSVTFDAPGAVRSGDFNALDELTYASAPDLEKAWCRFQDESAEQFSRRIANDILEARGLPPLPGRAPMQDRVGTVPVSPPRDKHPPRHDGRVAGRGGGARVKALA